MLTWTNRVAARRRPGSISDTDTTRSFGAFAVAITVSLSAVFSDVPLSTESRTDFFLDEEFFSPTRGAAAAPITAAIAETIFDTSAVSHFNFLPSPGPALCTL